MEGKLLKLAVEAGLPLIGATTRDILNLADVLTSIIGKTPTQYAPQATQLKPGQVYFYLHLPDTKFPLQLLFLYSRMVELESTLIVVNPPKPSDLYYNVGEIPVPKEMMFDFMVAVTDDEPKSEKLLRTLGGVTLKEAAEFARLTMARDNSLTPMGMMSTRKSSFTGSQGLTLVDTRQDFYAPPPYLEEWSVREKQFFLSCEDHRLIPRGLLMDGPPGTGKTAASKWMANQWDVPLYRLDIGATKNKYVGESEANLIAGLSRLDHEEPCIALLDEIEKVFGGMGESDGGTTTTMLSQLLWWLAERRSRVFVVMTTNNAKKLPKELYREGRINEVMMFEGLEWQDACAFVDEVFKTFPEFQPEKGAAGKVAKVAFGAMGISAGSHGPAARVSQASLTDKAYEYIKSASK